MASEISSVVNIALIGGGEKCREILKMTTVDFLQDQVNSRIVAVAESDCTAPGVILAQEKGLNIVSDYRQLYDPVCQVHLFILLDPDPSLLHQILKTKPDNLRVLSHQAFDLFWKAFKSREKLLQQRSKEMQTILDGIQDLILVITPEQEIVDVNEAFLKQMGYTKKEVVGKKCHEVYHQTNQSCFENNNACPLKTVIRNRKAAQTIRTRTEPKGKIHYMEVSIYPLWEKDGRISHFLEISHDITDRKVQEEENRRRLEQMVDERTRQLQETHAKLLHQDKMASLGKLSASVVHEINNPIAGILNFVLLMKRILKEDAFSIQEKDSFERYLTMMEAETRRISRIVSNLLTFSRQPKMKLGLQDINRLIEKTLILNDNLLMIHNVKIRQALDPALPQVIGSADQLQQVFMNMISNAAEAMESKGGGVLTVKTSCGDTADSISIIFTDTGVGITPDHLDKLFEPFYTTKKKGKGVGLGLSVVYGIINAHNGSITVDSLPGNGATFTIQLPLSPERQRAETADAARNRN
ncbi:MAG: PAS domain-containing protein [Desulfosarcina sp.]|nr:PAS domain-containing protein [Desulfosarcina sp.]MBC2741731.1 PAS domain-containing protein [Desulfosarcina sp.]MBC2764645.1 PAS domain-containing protein [Desulfosarcina sp.]